MKTHVYLAGFLLCLAMTGCAKQETVEIIPETAANNEMSTGDSNITESTAISETIMEHLTVNAEMEIPQKTFAAYDTELKEFDREKVAALLWPENSMESLQINEHDGGGTTIIFQNERLLLDTGSIRYNKSEDIEYLFNLVSYAEENQLLEEKELSFMTGEQAVKNAELFLAELELGADLGERNIYGVSKEDMYSIQNTMKSDEHYKGFFESGKFSERTFEMDDEVYYLNYAFSLDGLPVLGQSDPAVQMAGDGPLLAEPVTASLLYSNSGVCEVRLNGVLNQLERESGEQEIIRFDGIKKALIQKFGDVILTEDFNLTDMWLEYFPRIDENTFGQVELLPVWCCKFEINGDAGDYALRFNAFTGEELL